MADYGTRLKNEQKLFEVLTPEEKQQLGDIKKVSDGTLAELLAKHNVEPALNVNAPVGASAPPAFGTDLSAAMAGSTPATTNYKPGDTGEQATKAKAAKLKSENSLGFTPTEPGATGPAALGLKGDAKATTDAQVPAGKKEDKATALPVTKTSSRTSYSSSAVDKNEMDAILAKARKYADNEDADPRGVAAYQKALDDIEAKYQARKGDVAQSELIAQLGHALGLFIAGGGVGKLGKAAGVNLGSSEGAGAYTGEMLKQPAADFSKQYDRVSDEAARAEKGAAGVQQTKQSSWKDRMQAALEAASAARKTVSSGSGESTGITAGESLRVRDNMGAAAAKINAIKQQRAKDRGGIDNALKKKDSTAMKLAVDRAEGMIDTSDPQIAEALKTIRARDDWFGPNEEKVAATAQVLRGAIDQAYDEQTAPHIEQYNRSAAAIEAPSWEEVQAKVGKGTAAGYPKAVKAPDGTSVVVKSREEEREITGK